MTEGQIFSQGKEAIIKANAKRESLASEKERLISLYSSNELPDFEKLESLCNSLVHTEGSKYPIPKPLISFGGSLICRSGEITNIAGDSKTGKTALISSAIAACINPKTKSNLGFVAHQETKILAFDFEMPKDLFKSNIDKILKIANIDTLPNKFKAFPLRGLEIDKKQILVEYAIKKYQPDLVVLDTIADLQAGQNEEEGSNALVEWIMSMADSLEFGVLTTLHFNPGSQGKTRGHLGSQLERKVYHQLKIEKDENGTSKVSSHFNRQSPIEPVHFAFNEQKVMHTLLEDPKIKQLYKEFEQLELVEGKLYTYNDLVEHMEAEPMKWSNGKAKGRLRKFTESGLLIKDNLFYKMAENECK